MTPADDLELFLAEIGPRWAHSVAANVRAVVARYSPLLAQAPKDGIEVTRDVAYGAHPRQQLDVFAQPVTAGTGASRPVILFVHGGAFVDGERNRSDEVYSNVLYYFARHDIVGINIEYRLAPEHPYPAATEDVALALRWAVAHVAEFGGDPDSIFLMGHSAGAAHVASYGLDRRFHDDAHRHVAGLIIVSGRVRADNGSENPNARKVEAYYGTDASVYEDRSPVSHVSADSPPAFIAFAQYENPLIDLYCLELAYRIAQATRHAPALMRLPHHNHTSIIAHMNTGEDSMGAAIRSFVAEHRRFFWRHTVAHASAGF
jgi:acetyl esterase